MSSCVAWDPRHLERMTIQGSIYVFWKGSYRAIVFTTNELQELYSSFPEVIQMDSTFGTTIHGYKLIHAVYVDKYLKTHSVCFGLLSYLLADTMAVFVKFFAKTYLKILRYYPPDPTMSIRRFTMPHCSPIACTPSLSCLISCVPVSTLSLSMVIGSLILSSIDFSDCLSLRSAKALPILHPHWGPFRRDVSVYLLYSLVFPWIQFWQSLRALPWHFPTSIMSDTYLCMLKRIFYSLCLCSFQTCRPVCQRWW